VKKLFYFLKTVRLFCRDRNVGN